MRKSSKILGIGAGVAAIGILSTYAFAQQGSGIGRGRMGMGHDMGSGMMLGQGHGPMAGNFGDPATRLDTLKTELGIKLEQQTAWDAYAKVLTETAAAMQTHREHVTPDAVQKMAPKDREAFAAAMQKQRQDSQAKVKTAADALLAALDDTQKEKARQSLPGLVAGSGMGMRFGMMGGSGMGHHMGPPLAK